jgi:hypothetical protein
MSHLVNERMGKRQPMRWVCRGAHLLLQVRCAVLDIRLEVLSASGCRSSDDKIIHHY